MFRKTLLTHWSTTTAGLPRRFLTRVAVGVMRFSIVVEVTEAYQLMELSDKIESFILQFLFFINCAIREKSFNQKHYSFFRRELLLFFEVDKITSLYQQSFQWINDGRFTERWASMSEPNLVDLSVNVIYSPIIFNIVLLYLMTLHAPLSLPFNRDNVCWTRREYHSHGLVLLLLKFYLVEYTFF